MTSLRELLLFAGCLCSGISHSSLFVVLARDTDTQLVGLHLACVPEEEALLSVFLKELAGFKQPTVSVNAQGYWCSFSREITMMFECVTCHIKHKMLNNLVVSVDSSC